MSPSFWSDQDRLFVARTLGWSINFKYIARKLGWVKPKPSAATAAAPPATEERESNQDRIRRAVERSRFEQQ